MKPGIGQDVTDRKWYINFVVENDERVQRTVEGPSKMRYRETPLPLYWDGTGFIHDRSQALCFDSGDEAVEQMNRDRAAIEDWKNRNEEL